MASYNKKNIGSKTMKYNCRFTTITKHVTDHRYPIYVHSQ